MVSGSISSILASMQDIGNLQGTGSMRATNRTERGPGDLTEKIESQLESAGIETLESGKPVSEFIGELKTAIEETVESLGEDADPAEVHEAIKDVVSSLMEENGLNPEDFRPEPPSEGMPMPGGEQSESTGLMSQIGEQLAAMFSGQSFGSSSQLLEAINQLPAGAGIDVTA